MEQPQIEDSRSFWERMQSRPRARWLIETTSQLATAAWDAMQEEPPNAWKPLVIPEVPELTAEDILDRRRQVRELGIKRERELQSLIQIPPDREVDALEYARYRREQADWLTMEIGPGNHPSGLLRRDFTGKSAYIGIENCSFPEYSDDADTVFKDLRKTRPRENIFLRLDPNFGKYYPKERYGYYDFPDATADEIYISQVYDKPTLEVRNDDEEIMTNEAARLLKPGGKVIIFDYDRNLEAIVGWLEGAGLELSFLLRDYPTDAETGAPINNSEAFLKLQKELDCTEGDLIIIAEKPVDWIRSSASRIHAPFYPAPSRG